MQGIPCIINAEHGARRYFFCLFLSELTTPSHTLTGACTLATIVVLHVTGSLLTLFLPVVPSFRTNLAGQFAVHKEGIAIIAPRTPQINFRDMCIASNAAMIKHITVGYILWCRGSRDVGISLAEDVAILKPCCGRTENEVGGTFDVAILENLT